MHIFLKYVPYLMVHDTKYHREDMDNAKQLNYTWIHSQISLS